MLFFFFASSSLETRASLTELESKGGRRHKELAETLIKALRTSEET